MPLDLSLTSEQKQHVTVSPKTAAGNAAELDGPVTVDVTSGPGTVEVDADGKGFTVITPDVVDGTPTIYNVKGDADLGEGVETISDVVTLTTTAPKAASFGLVADAPVAK